MDIPGSLLGRDTTDWGAWGGHANPICSVEAPVIPIKGGQVPLLIIYTKLVLYILKTDKSFVSANRILVLLGWKWFSSSFALNRKSQNPSIDFTRVPVPGAGRLHGIV
jgi:hypothetical protein